MLTATIAASSMGDNEIVAAAAGFEYRVIAWHLSFAGTVNAKWRSATTDKTGLIYGILGAQAPSPALPATSSARPPAHFATTPGEALNLNLSGAVAVGGYVVYDKVPVGS